MRYSGLRRRATYDEIIHYLLYEQETISYPKRVKYKHEPLLEDMFGQDDDVTSLRRSYGINRADKATQTEPNDKAVQVDDGEDYDKYFTRNYDIIDAEAVPFPNKQMRTQTIRFTLRKLPPVRQPTPSSSSGSDLSYQPPMLAELLFGTFGGSSDPSSEQQESEQQQPPSSPSPPSSPTMPSDPDSDNDPTAASSSGYQPPSRRNRERMNIMFRTFAQKMVSRPH